LGIVVLDPTDKPIDIGGETPEDREHRRILKDLGKYDEFSQIMKLLRVVDLRMVDTSDFLIMNIDIDVHACGTYEEESWANRLKNPILTHCEQGRRQCPDWLFGTFPYQHMFSRWDRMCEYLWHVHTADEVDSYKRWMFFNYEKMVPVVTPEESRRPFEAGEFYNFVEGLDNAVCE
jgi:hypothetical protein